MITLLQLLIVLCIFAYVVFSLQKFGFLSRFKGNSCTSGSIKVGSDEGGFLANEKLYFNASTYVLPTKYNPLQNVSLSVVIPVKNEKDRLPIMLNSTLLYLTKRAQREPDFSYEVLVVDANSSDDTKEIALKASGENSNVRLLALTADRGKGGAVKRGVFCSRGEYILMADGDDATEFSDFEKLEEELKRIQTENSMGMVVGSRDCLKRPGCRRILSAAFYMLVHILCVHTICDTQCGFKLFTRRAAQVLFGNLHIEKWAFDVELIFLCEQLGIPAAEVSVTWRDVDGSKVDKLFDSVGMAVDIIFMRLYYWLGVYKTVDLTNLQQPGELLSNNDSISSLIRRKSLGASKEENVVHTNSVIETKVCV